MNNKPLTTCSDKLPDIKIGCAGPGESVKQKTKAEKAQELRLSCEVKLKHLIDMYFDNLSPFDHQNVNFRAVLDKEWKKIVNKVNSTQKLIKLNYKGFDRALTEIINSKNENIEDGQKTETN